MKAHWTPTPSLDPSLGEEGGYHWAGSPIGFTTHGTSHSFL